MALALGVTRVLLCNSQSHLHNGKPAPSRVVHVNSSGDWTKCIGKVNGRLVVVDYFATLCQPCKVFAPHFDVLSHQFPQALFVKVDGDACRDVTQQAGVRAFPTLKLYVAAGVHVAQPCSHAHSTWLCAGTAMGASWRLLKVRTWRS